MTTIIKVRGKDGPVAVCDERCYDAVRHSTGCICGGRNWAQGLIAAFRITRENFPTIAEEIIKRYPKATQIYIRIGPLSLEMTKPPTVGPR